MSVTLSEVKRAARAHRAPLAGESAGYLVLAIADQVLQAPRLVQAADIQLTEDGALRLVSGHASSDEDAELSLRRALDQLLLVASSGSAALTRASRRTAPLGLSSLVRELEAALIPVNRSAARRALARVHRETTRALQSGVLPEDDEPQAAELPASPAVQAPVASHVAPAPPAVAAPPAHVSPAPPAVAAPPAHVSPAPLVVASLAAPPLIVLREPNPEPEPVSDLDQDLETPALALPVLPLMLESHLDGVVSALCEQLPAPPQFVESDALASALPVRPVSAPGAAPEPEFLLEEDIEFETDTVDSSAAPTVLRAVEIEDSAFATDAVDSSAAPTVLRAVEVEAVTIVTSEVNCEQPFLDTPPEALTRPEPVVLRKALRPLLEFLPKPPADSEPQHQTPTLGSLASELPILAPEQIAEMSAASTLAAERAAEAVQNAPWPEDRTQRMPDALLLTPGVAIVESKKSDVSELLSSFQVAEPNANPGLCRAIKEMAELDLTPAPFAALIR